MVGRILYAFTCRRAQQAKQDNGPFGGLSPVVFSGDFMQLPPANPPQDSLTEPIVLPKTDKQSVVDRFEDLLSTQGGRMWKNHVKCVIQLDECMRCHGELQVILQEMREGTVSDRSWYLLKSRVVGHDVEGKLVKYDGRDPRLDEETRMNAGNKTIPSFNSNYSCTIATRHNICAPIRYMEAIAAAHRCARRVFRTYQQ